jgi:hypothetical protein
MKVELHLLFDHWLVLNSIWDFDCYFCQIESNNSLELDFQQPGSDLEMHLHNLLKERLPKAPRTLKELALQFNLFLLQLLSK